MLYQTLRRLRQPLVVCCDGEFYSLPDHVRYRGPWQGMHRGEPANLNPDSWLDIEEKGYALVRCELAVFKREA